MHIISQLSLFQHNRMPEIASHEHENQLNNENTDNNEINEIALYLSNRNPSHIQILQLIETSYCETECCFQLIRTTKTKTNFDRNTINTIEVVRGPRSNSNENSEHETYF